MNNSNDFVSFLNENLEKRGIDSISNIKKTLLNKENDVKEILKRLDDIQTKEQLKKEFSQTKFFDVFKNIFSVLNEILDEFTKGKQNGKNKKEFNLNYIKKIINKEQRIIYIGIFMIVCAIFLALIEISDSV
jgi:hypothetical protein